MNDENTAPGLVAGLDEAGRGPVLGPMAVAIVATDDEEALRVALLPRAPLTAALVSITSSRGSSPSSSSSHEKVHAALNAALAIAHSTGSTRCSVERSVAVETAHAYCSRPSETAQKT